MGVLLCPGFGVADYQPLAGLLSVLFAVAVHPVDAEHPFLHFWGLAADACPQDVLVACRVQQADVGLVHQPRVGHDDEVCQLEALDEVVDEGYHRVSIVLPAVEYGV